MLAGRPAVWRERVERDPLAALERQGDARPKALGGYVLWDALRRRPRSSRLSRRRRISRSRSCGLHSRAAASRSATARSASPRGDGSRAKKRPHTRPSNSRPDGPCRKRFDDQLDLDPARLVFIDETWASTNMARRYGRAPLGPAPAGPARHGALENDDLRRRATARRASSPRSCSMARSTVMPSRSTPRAFVPELSPGDVVVMVQPIEPQGSKRASPDRKGRRYPALPAAAGGWPITSRCGSASPLDWQRAKAPGGPRRRVDCQHNTAVGFCFIRFSGRGRSSVISQKSSAMPRKRVEWHVRKRAEKLRQSLWP